MRVDHNGLTVSAPLRLDQAWLDKALLRRADWVIEKLSAIQPAAGQMEWRHGMHLPYLGNQIQLHLDTTTRSCEALLQNERLFLPLPQACPTAINTAVIKWYRGQAALQIAERIALYAPRLGVALPILRVSNARRRWGSCNTRGEIRMSWRLIKAPLSQIDYVVAHELAHLREMNHSPAFWRVVEQAYPEYRAQREALRKQGANYLLF